MKYYYRWKLFRYKKVKKFLDEHPDECDAIEEIADEKANLVTAITDIEVAEDIQTTDTTGVTDDTDAAKVTMAETVVQYAHLGRPKARGAQSATLVKALTYEVYEITRATKADALSISRSIRKTLHDYPAIFTNIKPAHFTKMDSVITGYDAVQTNPSDAISNKKIHGTEALITPFQAGDLAIDNMTDYFVGEYMQSNPTFISDFKEACAIEVEGVRHTGLIATLMQANPPEGESKFLEGGVCKILEREREAITDINGILTIIKFKSGTVHVEFSKTGFKTKKVIMIFKRGYIEQVEIILEKDLSAPDEPPVS